MTVVAFVGLGRMGSRMARRLLDAGHDLVVWNRTPEKMESLVAAGAKPAQSPAEAARWADAAITMVSDPAALRAVTQGPQGIAAGIGAGSTLIEMSTVGPSAIAWLRSAMPQAAGLLDAPVLGSLAEAESGSLNVFVGGSDEVVARWTPLLSVLGSPLHVGPLGSGAAAKLVANSTLLGVLGVLGEALALAEALGLPRETTFDVLAKTPLAAQAERRRPAIEAGEFPARFSMALARKDADVITEEAAALGVRLRVLRAGREWFVEAEDGGWSDRDYAAVLAWMLERSRKERT
jgi:3-hydroxyisobutyrate dehydrogenase-like beta-hydroxyacid dehydrogenase